MEKIEFKILETPSSRLYPVRKLNIMLNTIENITSAFQPTWKEKDGDIDGIFAGLVKIAKKILERL